MGDPFAIRLRKAWMGDRAEAGVLRGPAAQQGLLQVLRDFCDHSNALCENCRFPEMVKSWREEGGNAAQQSG
jgi:hypothetical protein